MQNNLSINFEDLTYFYLQTAQALHDEIIKRATNIDGKVYLFFDEIQEVESCQKCINSLRVILNCDIYIMGSNAKLLSSELSTYLGVDMWNLSFIHFRLRNFWICTDLLIWMPLFKNVFKSI